MFIAHLGNQRLSSVRSDMFYVHYISLLAELS